MKLKLWIDDCREPPSPADYTWIKSTYGAMAKIFDSEMICQEISEDPCLDDFTKKTFINFNKITLIDIDHDAGLYVEAGGDYIKVLDWLEKTGRNYPIHIHSMNPVGVQNMRTIIQRNNWTEVF